MKTKCPHCNQSSSIPLEYQGKTVKCPNCKLSFDVPVPEQVTNKTLFITGIISAAAITGVIGYLCGALLTRVDRKEVEATEAKYENLIEKTERQLHDAVAEILRLKKQLKRSSDIIQQVKTNNQIATTPDKNPAREARIQKQQEVNVPRYGTIQRLYYEIEKKLGRSNRDVPKVQNIENAGEGIINITFSIDDNLTNGFIRHGAKMDFVDIIKAIQSSGYNYSRLVIFGTFPLVDKYGNSEESAVVRASYTPEIINKINWTNFLIENIYKIADWHAAHPEFQDK